MKKRLLCRYDNNVITAWCDGVCGTCVLRFKCFVTHDPYIEVTAKEWFKCKDLLDKGLSW
jgi:hypothetical protein